nr:hypothetical protein [uncultured Roseococcus sp.]
MSRELMGLIDVIGRLKRACRAAGSQKAWAQRHRLSVSYVNDVVNARIAPGEAILSALGLAKVTKYVELRKVNG